MWRVEFDIRAARELKKLVPETRKQILKFFQERIATDLDPRRFGKALTANLSGLWRYRIEDYRVICQLELVEIKPLQTNANDNSGIRLLIDGIEIAVAKGFDGTTLSEVLNLLKRQSCSASAAR